ncbi:MAG TPA: hypothetical protein VLA13_11095, partial [Massilibacterium sp.]|nr:hypothetical protein [Massilibacterium sp.]
LDDILFLKELQQELKTQEIDCQAAPRFWVIMDYKWEVTAEGFEERVVLYDEYGCSTLTFNEYVDEILNGERKFDFNEEEIEELRDIQEYDSFEGVFSWLKEYDDKEEYFHFTYEKEVSYIVPNTMFLTKKEAQEHLESNRHRYTSKAHTYAMTAWRAPKVKRLLEILETFDFYELAERVRELEKERSEWKDTAQSYYMTNQELREQNKRYREALEFYAEQDNYEWEINLRPQQEIDCMVIDDGGHTARKALEESE